MKARLLPQFIVVVILVSFLSSFSSVTLAQRAKKRNSSRTATETVESVSVPYTIDMNEESVKKGAIITLAVDAVTIIRCPEEPLQILFGKADGLDVSETKPGRTEIYLRPRIAQINTNIVIEMKSGPVALQVRTVEVKGGAHTGNYTGEIIIKNSGYKDQLIHANEALEKAILETTQLKDQIEKLKVANNEKALAACNENKVDLLKLVESMLQINDRRNSSEALKGQIRVSQIGKLQKTTTGYILNLAIENKGKQEFISLDDIKVVGSNVIQTSNSGSGRKINRNSEGRCSFLIEVDSSGDLSSTPSMVNLMISGTPITLKVS